MKKLIAVLLMMAMLMSLAACGGSGEGESATDAPAADSSSNAAAPAEPQKTVLHVGIGGSVTEVGPFTSVNEFREPIYNTMYETLFTTDSVSSTDTIPVIGKSWEMIDPMTVAIEIYDYVHDVDGNPITAEDVVFSYKTCTAAAVQTDTAYIDDVYTTGDYTLEMKLSTDAASTIIKLLTHINIVSQAAYGQDPDTTPGTSPYKLTSYINGSEYVFEKTGNYWQTPELTAFSSAANVDKIDFQIITETTQTTNALENGEIQMAIGVDGREAARFEEGGEDEEGFIVDSNAGSFSLNMLFNCTPESPCSDQNLRLAMLYAIDAENIVKVVLNGAGVPASDMASNQLNGFNPEWLEEDYYGYDPEKAADYLAKSSYNGETLRLEASNGYDGELQLIQAQLGAIGIKSEIQTFENALWQEEKVAGTGESAWDFQLDGLGGSFVTNAWKVKFNPSNFSTGLPQTGYLDEKLNDLLFKAADTQDPADIEAFHDYLYGMGYAAGLYCPAAKTVSVDTISDFTYSHKGYLIPSACNFDNYTVTE